MLKIVRNVLALTLTIGASVFLSSQLSAQTCGTGVIACSNLQNVDACKNNSDRITITRVYSIGIGSYISSSACVFCTRGCATCLNITVTLEIYDCNQNEYESLYNICCHDPSCCSQ